VLAAFWARNPEIAVDVRVAGSAEAAAQLAAGEADLALVFDQQTPRSLRRIAMAGLALGVLVPPGSRLTRVPDGPSLADLSGERVILSDSSLTLGQSVEAAMGDAFVDFARRARTNSIALMIELAEQGLGCVMQTRLGAEREIAAGTLVFLPLRERHAGVRRLMLIARAKAELSEAAAALGAALGQAIDALPPD
jgi:DNA-binding transcriptional LysR family regulator